VHERAIARLWRLYMASTRGALIVYRSRLFAADELELARP
jgi:hypothetical protein